MTGMIDKAPNPELAAEECWRPLGHMEALLLEAQLEREGVKGLVGVCGGCALALQIRDPGNFLVMPAFPIVGRTDIYNPRILD